MTLNPWRFLFAFLFVGTVLALSSGLARADVYGFVEKDGRVRILYTDTPPADPRFQLFRKDRHGASEPARFNQLRNSNSPSFGLRYQPTRFSAHILAAAKETKVEPALIHAVISVESGYNPSARSHAGAVGLMQLMPGTAERYGVKNRLDPAQNIHGGARYLRDLQVMFNNNLQLVLAAYNAGEQAVIKYGKKIPPYRETIDYVPKVLSHYHRYRTVPQLASR
jgi:soluble lytic murein transglycosylase-like protein